MDQATRNRLAILCAIGAAASFSFSDAMVKLLGAGFPLHQIMLIRSIIALLITLAVIVPLEGGLKSLRTKRHLLHIIRGVTIVIANVAFFSALIVIPIAYVTAIFFVSPLLITGFSRIFLKERVNRTRWIALAVGLVGVLFIIRPGSTEFQWALLLPLVAALAYSIVNTITRSMGTSESACAMTFYMQIMFLLVSGIASIFVGDGRYSGHDHPSLEFLLSGWVVPQPGDVLLFAASGIGVSAAGYLISQAYRLGESGIVTPFEYTALILAMVWGYLFWQEIPGMHAAAGIALILGSGVFVAINQAKFDFRHGLRRAIFGRKGHRSA